MKGRILDEGTSMDKDIAIHSGTLEGAKELSQARSLVLQTCVAEKPLKTLCLLLKREIPVYALSICWHPTKQR